MAWFKRKDKGIQTPTEAKRDTPKGLWYKSPTGKVIDTEELEHNFYVSPEDGYHVRIGSNEYFQILFDDNTFKELDAKLESKVKNGSRSSYVEKSLALKISADYKVVTYKAKLQLFQSIRGYENNRDTLLTVQNVIYTGNDFFAKNPFTEFDIFFTLEHFPNAT